MLQSIGAATERLIAYQDKVEAIAHNIANVGTFGYRSIDARFQATLHRALSSQAGTAAGPAPATGQVQAGSGSTQSAADKGALLWPRLQSQGQVVETGQENDFALRGDGFFIVHGPDDQTYYTRDGRFSVDGEGRLVTSAGGLVDLEWTAAPQSLAGQSFTVDRKGFLRLEGRPAGSAVAAAEPIARLKLAAFDSPENLKTEAGIYFAETPASGAPRSVQADADKLQVIQGSLETSNVDVIGDMTDLIAAQRSYEMVLRALQQTDAMLGMANNIRR